MLLRRACRRWVAGRQFELSHLSFSSTFMSLAFAIKFFKVLGVHLAIQTLQNVRRMIAVLTAQHEKSFQVLPVPVENSGENCR